MVEASDGGGPKSGLRAFDIGCVVTGGIIGVGIFFTPARVAAAVDTPAQVITVWCLGGLVAMLGAIVFADLSKRVPGHGGTFVYIHEAFGRLPAFLYGWANWLVIQSGALGVIGLICVDYLYVILHGDSLAVGPGMRVALAAGLIALFTVLNALGLRVGRPMQNALTVAKTLAVFLLVLIALFSEGEGFKESALSQSESPARSWLSVLAVSILPVLFAYGGWQQGSFLAGAARNPQRDVPLGIIGGTIVVVIAYIAINLSFLNLLGFEAAAQSKTIGADAARAALDPLGYGEMAARIFAGMVVISALGILNTICMAPPYVLHAMAKKGLFFAAAGRLDPRFGSPMLGVIVQGGWGIVLLLGAYMIFEEGSTHALDVLLTGVVFVDWIFFALCAYALLLLRRREGSPLVSLAGLASVLFAVLATAITVGAVSTSWEGSIPGLLVCLAGGLAFLLMKKGAREG